MVRSGLPGYWYIPAEAYAQTSTVQEYRSPSHRQASYPRAPAGAGAPSLGIVVRMYEPAVRADGGRYGPMCVHPRFAFPLMAPVERGAMSCFFFPVRPIIGGKKHNTVSVKFALIGAGAGGVESAKPSTYQG